MKLFLLLLVAVSGAHGQSRCVNPTKCELNIQAYSALNSAGCTDANSGFVEVNGVRKWYGIWCTSTNLNVRGINTLLLDPYTCQLSDVRRFDTHESASDAADLAAYIDYLDKRDKVLIGVTGDEPVENLGNARRILRSAGVFVDDVQSRGSFAFVIYPGHPEKTKFSKTISNSVAINTRLSATVSGSGKCTSNPCRNGGSCERCGTSVICTCPKGWTGDFCERVADPCQASPCKNGGSCTSNDQSFTCSCVPGWTGADCTTEVNVCLKGNPCKNGGTCVKFGDSYECKCTATWAGSNCDMGSAACSAVPASRRINCGWGGVTLEQCNSRSCCFDTTVKGRPACFYAVDWCQSLDFNLRTNCGFPGISYAQCVGRGCCYDDDETNTGPTCYRKSDPACVGIQASNRVARGDPNILPNECVAQGWCWDSSTSPSCFTTK